MYSKDELLQVTGGAFSWGVFTAITAGITFIVSVIDGYFRPLKCN